MATEEKKKELLEKLRNAVIQYDEDTAKEAANEALATGMEANDAIFNGLVSGMVEVGRMFEAQEYFVPELLMCADALYAGLDILKPHVKQLDLGVKGSVVIGTVEGDVHDIGKNIVKMMMEGAGYEIVDLGVDVGADKFVDAVRKESPDFVLMSALITLTMESTRRTIEALDSAWLRTNVKIGVGGAPLTQKFADEIGADFYASDAYECVQACNRLVESAPAPSSLQRG